MSHSRERESRQDSSAEDESSRGGLPDRVGYIEHGTGKHQSNEVFNEHGCSRTMQSTDWKDPMLVRTGGGSSKKEQVNTKATKSTPQTETLERLMQQSTNTQCLSKAIRSGGKGSLDRHMWDLISEEIL